MTKPAPLWLARPSRFSSMHPQRARWALALLAVLLLACLMSLASPGPTASLAGGVLDAEDRSHELMYGSVVDDLRHGASYYDAMARALRTGDYPLRPFLVFRLPSLAVLQSWVNPVAAALLLYSLALVALAAWWPNLRLAMRGKQACAVAIIALAAGMASAVKGDFVVLHETWAGILIALSLAARTPDRWVTAAAIGLCAMLIRESAALYVVIMASVALLEGKRREAAGWAATLGLFAIVLAIHAEAVADVVRPLDQVWTQWGGTLGFGFAIKAAVLSSGLSLLPEAVGAVLAGLALLGWAAWRDPAATRALATVVGYLLMLSFFGQAETFYWGFLLAPLLLLGLAFVPDALRDLSLAALDRRRFTVTRVSR